MIWSKRHRTAMQVRPGYWFARKLYGYGATPVTWQGWLLTFAGIALVALFGWLLQSPLQKAGAIVPLLVIWIYVIWMRTDGGFRWRWGPDDR